MNELKHQADIGEDFRNFLGEQVGQYITARAKAEEKAVFRKMAEVDPLDGAKVAMLQVKAQVPRKVIEWLHDVIKTGEEARFVIESMEAENDES